MSLTALYAPFSRVALFQGLKPIQIRELAQNAERISFRDGDKILQAGVEGDAAFLIVSGTVQRLETGTQSGALSATGARNTVAEAAPQVTNPANYILTDITAPTGTMLGEMSMLIDGHEHGATLIAKDNVRAFKLTRAAVHAQMEADRDLTDHFVQIIAGRLQGVAQELRRIDQTLAPRPASLATRLSTDQLMPLKAASAMSSVTE